MFLVNEGGYIMCVERGSTWNRWDFHVHTPYSILNNEFGFNIEQDHTGEHFDNFGFIVK